MPELSPDSYPLARPLFTSLERCHALVEALFEGQLSARVFVDDSSAPKAGVVVYNSRVLCAGDSSNDDFNGELANVFNTELIPAHKAVGNDAYLVRYANTKWEAALRTMFQACVIYEGTRRYYEIASFDEEKHVKLPNGIAMHIISLEVLASDTAGLHEVREEMCSERTSVEDFVAHSFGIVSVYENKVAGWCMSEYNVGKRCEIGIATAERHQRKGLATISTRVFLNEARRRGYTRVGWDCWTRNVPSNATARKAGLALKEEHPALMVVLGEDKEISARP